MALRRRPVGESPNHPPVPWLKTVVLNGAGKVGTDPGRCGPGRWAMAELASAVRSAERCSACIRTRVFPMHWDESEIPVYCPGGARRIGSMNPV